MAAAEHPRVFLSHSSKDKRFVEELHRRLMRDGVSCFFDSVSIGWGDNWVTALERALDECEYVIFVLSPDFCNSDWAQVERTSGIADDPAGLKRKMRPLMYRPCGHLPNFPRFLRHIQAIDVSTDLLFERNYRRICEELGGVVRDDAIPVDRNKLPAVGLLPRLHRMPYHSLGDKFVGRVEAIWELHDSLFHDSTAVLQGTGVLAGTGGLGKTQLAIEYAHRFGSAYAGGVYWVNADRGLSTLITQVSSAAEIDVDTKAEEEAQVEQVWRQLNARGTAALLILDNFPETGAPRAYLPTTGRVHTIVTTRRRDLGQATVRLAMLSVEEGVRLLNSGARRFGAEAAAVVERLGGLPLALELAKSYLNYRKDLGIAELVEEMRAAGEVEALAEFAKEYRDQLPSRHELDVIRTFQMSWDIASDGARRALRAIGELAPAPVPRRLLRSILKLAEGTGVRDELGRDLSELGRLSLVEVDAAGDPVGHRLILAFVRHRNRLDGESPFQVCVEAIQREMRRAFEYPSAGTSRELELVVPHAEFLVATDRMGEAEAGLLWNSLGQHHLTMGRYTVARRAYSAALASHERSYEPGDPNIGAVQSNLALVLHDLGQLEEARDLLRLALASDEKNFEPGHPSIASSQSNLAGVLKRLGQLEEARDLLRLALAANGKSFEPGHPSIAVVQSNLGLVLQDLGQLEEARDLQRLALASAEKSFEPGHSSIARSQSNLALVLQDLGQLEEARDLLRLALVSTEESFEPGHPTIAICQSNLATVLRDLGQLEEARDLLRLALASDEKNFEPGHPSIARSQSNLATVLKRLGQLEEARDLLRLALAANGKSFEPGHPSIAVVQSNLGLVLQDLGQLEEARDLLRLALTSAEKSFEPGHPSIAIWQSNLAGVLQDLGQFEEARDLLRHALTSDEKSFEPGHPSIASSQSNLATVLKRLGQFEEARDLLRRAYSASLERYGPDFPATRIFKRNLDSLPEE